MVENKNKQSDDVDYGKALLGGAILISALIMTAEDKAALEQWEHKYGSLQKIVGKKCMAYDMMGFEEYPAIIDKIQLREKAVDVYIKWEDGGKVETKAPRRIRIL